MALDPQIALGYRPPQVNIEVPHPLEQFGQVLSLRNMMTQGQMNQIALQSGLLKLQQEQQALKEQRWLSDYYAKQYAGGSPDTAEPGAAPVVPPVAPPVQPTPVGGTAAQIAPATAAPPTIASMVAPPTPAPQGAATVAPNFGLTPAAPAATAVPARPTAATGTLFGLDAGQILRNMPTTGMGVLKSNFEFQKAQNEALTKDYEMKAKKADGLAGIARGVEAATDKNAAFTQGVMNAVDQNYMTPEQGRTLLAHGYNHDDMQAFIERSDKFKEYHEAGKADIESLGKAQENAGNWLKGVNDQATYTAGFSQLDPRVQRMLGPVYSPQLREHGISWTVSGAELPKMQMGTREAQAGPLAAALSRSPAEFQTQLSKLPIDDQALFSGAKTPLEVMQRAQNPDKYVEEARLMRGQLLDAGRLNLERGKFEVDKAKFDAEYGPGTAESAAEQIYNNPDSVREVLGKISAGMYPQVQRILNNKYGLPLPMPLEGAAKQQEGAAKGTLTDIQWIRNALQNPNIAKNIGPILGRLQNVEQATGEATGLTGADAAMAQEFRTRMRNMLANEAGALYKRVNPKVMDDLGKSSGNITMGSDMLSGALNGVEETVKNKLDTFEQQRWGNKMRPAEARGMQPSAPSAAQQKALADLPHDGKIHQLSDGSVWQVNTDGRITPAQAPR